MGFDLYAEVDRAKFLDFVSNNKDKIIDYLLLENEELLLKLYNNQEELI